MIPKTISTNRKRIKISNKVGKDASRECTSILIPGMLLMVRSGLRIRMTLIADTFEVVRKMPIHPMITTTKSNCKGKQRRTYNIPGIAQIRVLLGYEPHGNNLDEHLSRVYTQEYVIRDGLKRRFSLGVRVLHGDKDAVENDC